MSCSAARRSDGVVSIVDNTVPANWPGPYLHRTTSTRRSTCWRASSTFQVEDAVITKRAGELAFAPRGVAHTLANHSDGRARYLLVCTPAGFERYFARMNENPPEWALQEIPFEVERVGPQIGQS